MDKEKYLFLLENTFILEVHYWHTYLFFSNTFRCRSHHKTINRKIKGFVHLGPSKIYYWSQKVIEKIFVDILFSWIGRDGTTNKRYYLLLRGIFSKRNNFFLYSLLLCCYLNVNLQTHFNCICRKILTFKYIFFFNIKQYKNYYLYFYDQRYVNTVITLEIKHFVFNIN